MKKKYLSITHKNFVNPETVKLVKELLERFQPNGYPENFCPTSETFETVNDFYSKYATFLLNEPAITSFWFNRETASVDFAFFDDYNNDGITIKIKYVSNKDLTAIKIWLVDLIQKTISTLNVLLQHADRIWTNDIDCFRVREKEPANYDGLLNMTNDELDQLIASYN